MARYDLKLSDEEFGDLSYGQFEALLDRKKIEEKKEYLRTGMIAAAVINFGFCRPEKLVDPMAFVPGEAEPEKDLNKMTPAEQAQYMMNQFSKRTFSR